MVCWRPTYDSPNFLMHYAKGQTAKKHKYIRKEGDRYIYPDDDKPMTWDQHMKKSAANIAYRAAQDAGKSRTDQENIDAARDWRRTAPSSNRAMLTAREEQLKGYIRTREENVKSGKEKPLRGESLTSSIYDKPDNRSRSERLKDFARRDLQVKKAAKAAQEAGKKRTNYEAETRHNKKMKDIEAANEAGRKKTEYEQALKNHTRDIEAINKAGKKKTKYEQALKDKARLSKSNKVRSITRKALKKGKKNLNTLLNKIKRR